MQGTNALPIPGLYSTQAKVPKRMDGIRLTTFPTKIFWYASYDDAGKLSIQPLNNEMLPSGVRLELSLVDLAAGYDPEIEEYERTVLPKMRKLDGILEKADELREEQQHAKAACEYRRALSMDEENVRGNFGVGIVYLAQGEKEKAGQVFKKLLKMEGTFEKTHKHMFNEFGISLRKNKMLPEAVAYYGRAIELTKDDDNLHVNMARPLCEQKKFAASTQHLLMALRLAPDNKTARDFLTWMQGQKLVPLHLQMLVEKALSMPAVPKAQLPEEDILVLPDDLFE